MMKSCCCCAQSGSKRNRVAFSLPIQTTPWDSTLLRTRFAPSPTGLLHIGNGYSALLCQQWAEQNHGALLLRIEDIDSTRCQTRFVDGIKRDLAWLGISWQPDVMVQSQRQAHYQKAIKQLQQLGVLYPCFCSRAMIRAQIAISAPHQQQGYYPGTCRNLSEQQRKQRMQSEAYAWRLHAEHARAVAGPELVWNDADGIAHAIVTDHIDDVVLVRKDIGISYHLAVVVDDAAQQIDMVIRGKDLLETTALQLLLQQLLNLPHPRYMHHALVVDHEGKRLAKRNHATTLLGLAQQGIQPDALKAQCLSQQSDSDSWRFSPP